MKHPAQLIIGGLVVLSVLYLVYEGLVIRFNGKPVPPPSIPRGAQLLGSGRTLTYVVMGDSTSIGQGAPYNTSYAHKSAEHLTQRYQVTFINTGVSGARVTDVADGQLKEAVDHRPDIVLLAVGANDVTHVTSPSTVRQNLVKIIEGLRASNPGVRIVVTGSPDMGSVSRFGPLARFIAEKRTALINSVYEELVKEYGLTFARIAERTGSAFRAHPTLYAADKFHPNEDGYALWTPVIIEALDTLPPAS